MIPPVVLLLLLLTAGALTAQTPESSAWMRRPDIRSIRTIVTSLDGSLASRRFVERDTTVACYDRNVRFEITSHTDWRHVVRRIHFRGGSEDAAHDVTYSYDRRGRLRFAFASRGAVNGTHEEERVYYSERGNILHRDVRRLAGPGYPWEPIDAITDPNTWLRNPCD